MTDDQKWQRPALLVLTRSTPEEAVLFPCKTGVANNGSPATSDGFCSYLIGVSPCEQCNTPMAS